MSKQHSVNLGAAANQGSQESEYTFGDYMQTVKKQKYAAFMTSMGVFYVGLIMANVCALVSGQFSVNTWPSTISSLVSNPFGTTWGLAFYGFTIVAGILLIKSEQFAYSPVNAESYGDFRRSLRHYIIAGSVLLVVLIPTDTPHDASTDQTIIASLHYIAALIALFVYPLTELILLYQSGQSMVGKMWKMKWVWATLFCSVAFIAIRIAIGVLDWLNDDISNALTITCYCLELVAIIFVTFMAWTAPIIVTDA